MYKKLNKNIFINYQRTIHRNVIKYNLFFILKFKHTDGIIVCKIKNSVKICYHIEKFGMNFSNIYQWNLINNSSVNSLVFIDGDLICQ